jgi:hypothetical protein
VYDYQYNDLLNRTGCVPSLFTVSDPLNKRDADWIVENELRRFKVDTVFGTVRVVLCAVLFDPHLY